MSDNEQYNNLPLIDLFTHPNLKTGRNLPADALSMDKIVLDLEQNSKAAAQAASALRALRQDIETGVAIDSLPEDMAASLRFVLDELRDVEQAITGGAWQRADVNRLTAVLDAGRTLASTLPTMNGAGQRKEREADEQSRLRGSISGLHSDLFEKKVLAPYLQFDSEKDKEVYRKREQEREEQIKRLRAVGTPEAWNEINQLHAEQLADAKAHGAAASPDFGRMEAQATQNLRDAEALARPTTTSASLVDDLGRDLLSAGVLLPAAQDNAPTVQTTPAVQVTGEAMRGLS